MMSESAGNGSNRVAAKGRIRAMKILILFQGYHTVMSLTCSILGNLCDISLNNAPNL